MRGSRTPRTLHKHAPPATRKGHTPRGPVVCAFKSCARPCSAPRNWTIDDSRDSFSYRFVVCGALGVDAMRGLPVSYQTQMDLDL